MPDDSYELRAFSAKHFPQLADRKQREHAGEQRLKEMFFGDRKDGLYVEVGANDPVRSSQTWHLERQGWKGLLVEPIPDLCEELRRQRPGSRVIEAACGAPDQRGQAAFHVGVDSGQSTLVPGAANTGIDFSRTVTVQVKTLDDILEEAGIDRPDFLSIDVEGLQWQVLQGLTLRRHGPTLLLIEDHLHDLRTHRHLLRHGYRLVKRTGLNNWYVPAGTPFNLTTAGERLKLWRKVWLGTPWRGWRHRRRASIR
ncbi:MAG: FkbM family methyltransferase [Phycisphaeraceae bacterium]|nr:FkbM family methyltransferase [Phycisphaeraceae bacterium]